MANLGPAAQNLPPQQQQSLAALQLGLMNQWAQILMAQGITNPIHSPQWAQVQLIVNQQVQQQLAAFQQANQRAA
jgi:hypothetical protein